jgi:hypothetical protein
MVFLPVKGVLDDAPLLCVKAEDAVTILPQLLRSMSHYKCDQELALLHTLKHIHADPFQQTSLMMSATVMPPCQELVHTVVHRVVACTATQGRADARKEAAVLAARVHVDGSDVLHARPLIHICDDMVKHTLIVFGPIPARQNATQTMIEKNIIK